MSPDDLAAQLEQLHAAAFGWALSCCAWDRPAAEDALQSSYLKILDGRARFAGRSSFRTWVFGVIRRTAQAARRRGLRRRWWSFSRRLVEPEAAAGRPDPEAVCLAADGTCPWHRALARLRSLPRDGRH